MLPLANPNYCVSTTRSFTPGESDVCQGSSCSRGTLGRMEAQRWEPCRGFHCGRSLKGGDDDEGSSLTYLNNHFLLSRQLSLSLSASCPSPSLVITPNPPFLALPSPSFSLRHLNLSFSCGHSTCPPSVSLSVSVSLTLSFGLSHSVSVCLSNSLHSAPRLTHPHRALHNLSKCASL